MSNNIGQNNNQNQLGQRRNHHQSFQSESNDDQIDLTEFDTGNEYSSAYNRDAMDAQIRSSLGAIQHESNKNDGT